MPGVRPGALLGHSPGLWTPSKAAAAAFTPLSLSPMVWFKADAGTSTTTDGVAISQWNDQSGNTRNLTQAGGTAQPLYKAAIKNGLPIVRFDGTNDSMGTAAFSRGGEFTICAVASSTGGTYPQNISGDGNNIHQFRYASATQLDLITFAGPVTDSQATTAAAFHAYTGVRSAAAVQTWVDGASDGSTANASTASVSVALFIGTQDGSGQPFFGDIGEYLWFPSALSTTDRQSVEAYLKARWATP